MATRHCSWAFFCYNYHIVTSEVCHRYYDFNLSYTYYRRGHFSSASLCLHGVLVLLEFYFVEASYHTALRCCTRPYLPVKRATKPCRFSLPIRGHPQDKMPQQRRSQCKYKNPLQCNSYNDSMNLNLKHSKYRHHTMQ